MAVNERLGSLLIDARARTASILEPFDDAVLRRQHDRLMSPLVWDLAHVANYEDLWLVRALGGAPTRTGLDDLYDAFKQPRHAREALPLLDPKQARQYAAEVRSRALDVLAEVDVGPEVDLALLRDGFVHTMVVQHEHQHAETLLAAIQLLPPEEGHRLESPPPPASSALVTHEVLVPSGSFTMGSDAREAYDNERPPHEVHLDAYFIDAAPVTNGQFQAFIEAGGYDRESLWSTDGWAWRQEAALTAPQFWQRDGGGWVRVRFGRVEPVPADEPVQHVCWYEADAYGRWAGKRLPTEAEWERAARGTVPDPEVANVGQRHLGPAPVGAYPSGVSEVGCHQMLGDVWEWTATDFGPYPGFVAFPYQEYSAVFHGDAYKVLRGGSWATHPVACRSSFRNWDLPIRRQIFAGFRCARDAR
ncbi:MAG: ergothioneine biosynthesis protein EgtB [Microthrixaceae bacterium]